MLSVGTFSPAVSFAQTDTLLSPGKNYRGFIPECAAKYGDCSLCDIVNYAIDIMRWMVRFVGIAVFIMVLYGGITLLISQGKSEQTETGRTIIKNSLIGLLIVLCAWTLVNVIIGVLGGKSPSEIGKGTTAGLFSSQQVWNECPKAK